MRFQKLRPTWITLSIAAVILGVAGYLILANSAGSFTEAARPTNCLSKKGDTIEPAWFKTYAGIELPPGARDVSAACDADMQSYTAYVRLTIAPADVNRLIASSSVKPPLSSAEKPLDMTTHEADLQLQGWDISSIRSFLAGEGRGTGSVQRQSILIDTSNSAAYVVYVVSWG